jgi:lysyl-tRNA synthetase class 2
MGKATFVDLRDATGRMQLYIKKNDVGEEAYADFNTGTSRHHRRRGLRVQNPPRRDLGACQSHTLLAKSLLPLPDKWHGLKDTELRYRQRYVDLIASPEVHDAFVKRSHIIREIRAFLDGRGYLEWERPCCTALRAALRRARLRPTTTRSTSTLLCASRWSAAPQRLLSAVRAGVRNRRVFRNEGIDTRHNPEFTLLELYEAYPISTASWTWSRSCFAPCRTTCWHGTDFYGGTPLDFDAPFERVTMTNWSRRHTGVDFSQITTLGSPGRRERAPCRREPRLASAKFWKPSSTNTPEKNIVGPTFAPNTP